MNDGSEALPAIVSAFPGGGLAGVAAAAVVMRSGCWPRMLQLSRAVDQRFAVVYIFVYVLLSNHRLLRQAGQLIVALESPWFVVIPGILIS